MSDAQNFNLNDADGGRAYIGHLFQTVLKRHDYRQYIAERLAGDFACTLAQHFEDIKAREAALQQRLTAADERGDAARAFVSRLIECSGDQPSIATGYLIDILDVLKPAEPATDEHVCTGCGTKGWTASCKECMPY